MPTTTAKKGPIYSRSSLDRPGDRNSVIDYADRGRSREELAFMAAHGMTPGLLEPRSQQPDPLSSLQGTAAVPDAAAKPSQRHPDAGPWSSAWVPRSRERQRTPAQQHAAMIALLVWSLFILLSILMSIFGGR